MNLSMWPRGSIIFRGAGVTKIFKPQLAMVATLVARPRTTSGNPGNQQPEHRPWARREERHGSAENLGRYGASRIAC